MEAKEVWETDGVVEAVAQHDGGRYSVKVGGEWYGGFGTCPVEKGLACVIEYTVNGRFRNVKSIKELGTAVAQLFEEQLGKMDGPSESVPAVPLAVRNYRTDSGWNQAAITEADEELIQSETRRRNCRIVAECIEDARHLLADSGVNNAMTPKNVLDLTLLLSERRTAHVSKVIEEFIKRKVATERNSAAVQRRESESAGLIDPEAEA